MYRDVYKKGLRLLLHESNLCSDHQSQGLGSRTGNSLKSDDGYLMIGRFTNFRELVPGSSSQRSELYRVAVHTLHCGTTSKAASLTLQY